jgi:hypothetical protein
MLELRVKAGARADSLDGDDTEAHIVALSVEHVCSEYTPEGHGGGDGREPRRRVVEGEACRQVRADPHTKREPGREDGDKPNAELAHAAAQRDGGEHEVLGYSETRADDEQTPVAGLHVAGAHVNIQISHR